MTQPHFGQSAQIEKGHRSTLHCHLGNNAYRTQRTLKCGPGERPHPRRRLGDGVLAARIRSAAGSRSSKRRRPRVRRVERASAATATPFDPPWP